ncbi:MAG: M50 family metallopeptidase [Chloroflexota bacterium]
MDILIHYILPFLGMLIALIVIHEAGHYFTAKLFGIKVLEAGLGYPPRAIGREWRGTIYSINWLPLGGFVRLLGEEDPTDPQSLAAQAAWKRIIVLGSGAFMNFVLVIVLFTLVFLLPRTVPKGPAVIDVVEVNSPASVAQLYDGEKLLDERGLHQGDVILKVDGHNIENTQDAGRYIRIDQGKLLTFDIQRNDTGGGTLLLQAKVQSRWDPPDGQGPTGIQIKDRVTGSAICQGTSPPDQCYNREHFGLFTSIHKGWTSTIESLQLARNQVIAMFKGGSGPSLAGPVGIAQATGEVVKEDGWVTLLQLAALLSLNLGIINILPLPMLDGGRIFFVLIEIARRGKRIAPEKEAIVHLVGLALIITMAVVVTYVDVARLISGKSLFS